MIDKRERDPHGSAEKLAALGLADADVAAFIANPDNAREALAPILDDLAARGMDGFVTPDLSIVRGLAYYTGAVFEVFDAACTMRAVAGGGRYDNLVNLISDGKVDLPAVGFAMGNIVILDLIQQCGEARMRLEAWKARQAPADIFVIVADEASRPHALATVQHLRDAGHRTDLALTPASFNKQFQAAESIRATIAVIIGSEYPDLSVKNLSSRQEIKATPGTLLSAVHTLLDHPARPASSPDPPFPPFSIPSFHLFILFPCAPTIATKSVPPTSASPSRSPAGSIPSATTTASSSSICATARA